MSRIKYTDQIASNPLMSYHKKDAAKPKNEIRIIRYIEAVGDRRTPFEKHWGCKPDEIVLTKGEEEEWNKKTQKI